MKRDWHLAACSVLVASLVEYLLLLTGPEKVEPAHG